MDQHRTGRIRPFVCALAAAGVLAASSSWAQAPSAPAQGVVGTIPNMPAVPDPTNLYSETVAGRLAPHVARHLPRIYVPSRATGAVLVLDPQTLKVVDTLRVPGKPRFVVPSWDLQRLWVVSAGEERAEGALTPIDPATAKAGTPIPVDGPHNLYWSGDGRHAIVVARAHKRLDFRDARSMALEYSVHTPDCDGVSHAEVSISGRFAAFTCEEGSSVTKIDLVQRRVVDTIKLSRYFRESPPAGETPMPSMPQDLRLSPDGQRLFVSDLAHGGVHMVDFASFRQVGFIPTGPGAHGVYPSRDGKQLYVANRGTTKPGERKAPGSVSVIDFASRKVIANWPVPGGGSPDMGTVSADGRYLWLAAKNDDEVYRFDTRSGAVATIKLGLEPHSLLVWPQPGRYSLGYTGLLR